MTARSAKKVAYIMSRFPTLTETFVLFEIIELERAGIEVGIYPLLRSRPRTTHPEALPYVARAHYAPFLSPSILRSQWFFIRRNPAAYFRTWLEILRSAWGSMNFFIGALGIFPKSVHFARQMLRRRVTHVHAHFANHPTVAALIVHRLTGLPFSFTAHGHDLHVERRMLDKKIGAAAFAVTVCEANKSLMLQACEEQVRGKIHVLHCGIDPDTFRPRRDESSRGPLRILSVGSLAEVKGHAYLLDACDLLQRWDVDFACDIVGQGPLRARLRRKIAHHGLEHRVHLHGARARPQVVRMLQQADVFSLASVRTRNGKREGIPVALMEAMASELAVVASDISGIPELIESGANGLLVRPRDARGLARALKMLADDAPLRRRLGRAGRRVVLERFNLRTNAASLGRRFSSRTLEIPAPERCVTEGLAFSDPRDRRAGRAMRSDP